MIGKLEKLGVKGYMMENIRKIYKETRNTIKIGSRNTRIFKTGRGLRQGCPLSPTLFNIYIADMEEKLRGNQEGGIILEKMKIWMLAYADDMVVVADEKGKLQSM